MSNKKSMAGVGRAGFIRDPSGLLMSIIRQLAASEDNHQRELEKERLEEAFKENDERLDELVADNYEELAISIKQFGRIGERITDSRSRIRRVREDLQQCKSLLYCRQDELRKLWVEGVEYKNVLFLLDQIESVKSAPQMVEGYLSKKFYLHATELITQTLSALRTELTQVEALHDTKNELIGKKLTMHERFIVELHRQIYVASMNPPRRSATVTAAFKRERKMSGEREATKIGKFDKRVLELEDLDSDPEEDPFKLMTVLVESLARLQRIPDMVEATQSRLDRHINMLVTHTTVEVTDNAFHDEDKAADDPKRLLQLLNSLFRKFRCVVDAHNHVLATLSKIVADGNLDVMLYRIEDVWAKIQSVLQVLLNEYLDADNVASRQISGLGFSEGVSLSSHFSRKKNTRPRVAKLFRFDASSHAISMNTYLREQRAQRRTNSPSPLLEHALSTQKVCRPNPRNITLIFGPLKAFISEIESSSSEKKCALHDYITDYVQDVFIRQIQFELKKDFDTSMKVTDPLKVIADPAAQKNISGFKQILQSAVVADQCIWFLYDLTCSLDSYHDHFLTMALSLLQEYKEMSIQSYRGVVQPESEDKRIVSASWVRDPEFNRVLCDFDNWKAALGGAEPRDARETDEVFARESQFFVGRMEGESLSGNSLIEDPSDLGAVASLHEALQWMTGRLRSFVEKIRPYAPLDTMEMLEKLGADYERMSEICLLCLHIELRLLCFLLLTPMFRNNNYDIRGLDSMEHDSQVSDLSAAILAAEESLSSTLQPRKFRYVFEGLGHQVAAILIAGAKHMARMSPSGVKKMCRNVFALQQLLTNITESRESRLDTARQFYELLYLCPDDLQAQVVEQGVRYGEDDYIEALKLLHRSKAGSGSENEQWARTQRLRAIVREQTYKKEHAQAMQRLALDA